MSGKRSWLTLGALACVVAALGLWLYYKPTPEESNTFSVSALKSHDVKRLRVERFDIPLDITLERREAAWHITAPFKARADTFQVGRLLTVLDVRSAVRYPAGDAARYGLEKPVRVTLEDQSFTFGAYNTVTREQYVQSGDAVYAVPLGPGAALPRDVDALIGRELFARDETPVRIELPDFTAVLQDNGWQFTPANDASADDRLTWVETWQHAIALRSERYDGALPGPFVRVTVKSGPVVTLGIVSRDPEFVMVRVDESIAYHFVTSVGKRLLSPPAFK